jgi:4-hydroxybenzoate polyprenyltransferase
MAAHRMRLDPISYSIELSKILVVAFLMRSYGGTINDIFDYELDRNVGACYMVPSSEEALTMIIERCKTRPLASNRISYRNACMFACGQVFLVIGICYAWFNRLGSVALA